jgi:hypothetical protein
MITHAVVRVTPQMAVEWLARLNHRQRAVRRHHVFRLAQDIRNGDWKLTPDPIVWCVDDTLINGQHRLHAIAMAGVPALAVVTRGWPEATYEILDAGMRRALTDRISDASWLRFNVAVAMVRVAMGSHTNGLDSEATHVAFALAGEAYFEPIVRQFGTMGSPINSPVLAASARALMHGVAEAQIGRFLRVVKDPALSEGVHESAAVRFRQAADARKRQGGVARTEVFRIAMRALELFSDGQVVSHLKNIDREVYPLPADLARFVDERRGKGEPA